MRRQSWLQPRLPNPDASERATMFHKHRSGRQVEVPIKYRTHVNKSRDGRKIREAQAAKPAPHEGPVSLGA